MLQRMLCACWESVWALRAASLSLSLFLSPYFYGKPELLSEPEDIQDIVADAVSVAEQLSSVTFGKMPELWTPKGKKISEKRRADQFQLCCDCK